MSTRLLALACFILLFTPDSNSQQQPLQSWWDVLYYTIAVAPDYDKKSIAGTNHLQFVTRQPGRKMQIDLTEPMRITRITYNSKALEFERTDKYTYHINFPTEIKAGQKHTIVIHFEGRPQQSLDPPNDNGWIWAKDEKGRPWMSIMCQSSGASVWLPCKDVLNDEPDYGASFSISVPDSLIAVANGRLQQKYSNRNGTTTYTWAVVSPINNYNIIPYIGKYVSWREEYNGLKGKLDCDYWVLDYNLDKGKKHLKQSDTMLRAFEYWLGPYPFYKDGFKVVEAPMPGMEHQSAIAYGNGFQNGYRGKDIISGTGWGLKWDFMLVHEGGHEWFGNNITCSSHGETWIHEGFTKYLETLYTDYVFGTAAGNEYALGTWKRIKNDKPILGTNTSDKYYKGSAMIQAIRQIIGDSVFRGWLRGMNEKFYHQTIDTKQVLNYLNQYTKQDFSKIFDQYLGTTKVPVLEYSFQQNGLNYRWTNCVEGFDLPVKISIDGENYMWVYPKGEWQKLAISETSQKKFSVDKNFYIQVKEQAK